MTRRQSYRARAPVWGKCRGYWVRGPHQTIVFSVNITMTSCLMSALGRIQTPAHLLRRWVWMMVTVFVVLVEMMFVDVLRIPAIFLDGKREHDKSLAVFYTVALCQCASYITHLKRQWQQLSNALKGVSQMQVYEKVMPPRKTKCCTCDILLKHTNARHCPD